MPVNFTDSPSNGDTVTSGGFIYTYDSTNARWKSSAGTSFNTEEVQDVAGAMFTGNTETGITATYQDSDGTVDLVVPEATGIAVYATMALLIAATGMSTGDLAYVTANNKLYLYSVNGWFLVATVANNSPTAITGVGATTTLASDGTATVITAVSTDPEGFPLTWSYAVTTGSLTNGGGVTATVSQNANVFTITPSTTEAYAGTFSITFTVTDGTSGAVNAVSAFTLAFAPDWTATTQQAKLVASYPAANDNYGKSVAISGDYAVVGSPYNDTGASNAGAVYIYIRSGTTWSLQAKIQASDKAADDYFGMWVAIDGDTVAVGAPYEDTTATSAGSAYIFTRSGTTWSQQQKLQSSDIAASDRFGWSTAIDGDTVVIGAKYEDTNKGAAYVFTRSGTTWSQQAKLVGSDRAAGDREGLCVSISGDTVLVGSADQDTGGTNAGAAYVFTRSGTTWTQQQKLVASDPSAGDQFGWSLGIDGDTVIVGALYEDTGGADTGAAYIFTRSGTTWSQQQMIQGTDSSTGDRFGNAVSITGDTAVVGSYYEDTTASNAGSVYIFTRSGTTWTQQKKIQSSDIEASDFFGNAVSINDDTVLVGAYNEDTGGSNAGAAYTFIGG